ncbi:MAG: aromatic ring-hydroxylating dioxygenase subunit alpha [Alphaproteobacteria bacterium]|nr:aromatic ring-hydroxylating dioxygenase subunit alpha [Alphaproteobacteria bacterium]
MIAARKPEEVAAPEAVSGCRGGDGDKAAKTPIEDTAAPLRDVWYYATPGFRLRRGRMLAKVMLGEPILIGRDAEDRIFALRDLCPHRGMRLSAGRFDGREVECCYHGWRFDCGGRCTRIPSLVPGQAFRPDRIHVRTYPVQEVQGNIWIFFGENPAEAPQIPLIDGFGRCSPNLVESVIFSAAIDHAVVGLMDPAHGPFVHRAWWWRSRRSIHRKAKSFVPSPFGFTMSRHAPSNNSRAYRLLGGAPQTEIVFRLPSVRVEHIRAGRHVVSNLTAITPIDGRMTEINHCIYWTSRWLGPLKPFVRHYVRAFLHQDREIMERQQKGLCFNPPLTLIDDADTQAKWYYRLKREYRRARAEGRAFENPVDTRILEWRS